MNPIALAALIYARAEIEMTGDQSHCALGKLTMLAATLIVAFLASAESFAIDYREEYSRRIKGASNPAALGDDLFGDSVDWYLGTVHFRVVDVDLPGNNALPVRVARKTNTSPADQWPQLLGNWEIEVPYISGIFAAISPWRADRCSGPQSASQAAPPSAQSNPIPTPAGAGVYTTFSAHEYWRGYNLHIPGQPSAQLLWRDPSYSVAPSGGTAYRWVTNSHIQLSCLSTLASGQTGEGFLAATPDGLRYYFNWLITKPEEIVVKPILGMPNLQGSVYGLDRVQTRLYATRIEDSFGNYVNFVYTGDRLTKIQSSDGRLLSIQYNQNGKIDRITASGVATLPGYDGKQATWIYGYSATGYLSSVTLPDGSSWQYSELTRHRIYYSSDPRDEGEYATCDLPPENYISSTVPSSATWSMVHPSGAVGTFKLAPRTHYRSNTGSYCGYLSAYYSGATIPRVVRQFSLIEKMISGPSISNQKWSVDYAQVPGITKTVTVTNPDLSSTKYVLGTEYFRTEGKLLGKQTYEVGGALAETETYSYATDPINPLYSYRVGRTGMENFNQGSVPCCENFDVTMQLPIISTTITRNGVTYTRSTAVGDFDLFARPRRIVRGNTTGATRTDLIEYSHNYSKWVIGQVASIADETTGLVERSIVYNAATALPDREYRFGRLDVKYTYYSDGTLQAVKDGLERTTTLSNWKRGVPQLIQFADGSSMSAVVNDLGWITSETDQRGSTTGYGYDQIGRLASVTYPIESASTWQTPAPVWQNPTITYSKLSVSELGLPIGTWRKQEIRGRHRTRTYYDARLQPILEEDADMLAGQYIYRRYRYDYRGRVIFESYPSSNSSASTGINSIYDALQRLRSRATTDGVVLETSEYLTGGKRRITDADNRKTTISYQAFDVPDYRTPIRIEGEETQLTVISRDSFGKVSAITQSGTFDGSFVSYTRTFTYDAYQRPCRRVDPESGSTVWGYDGASQIVWELKGTSGSGCLATKPSGATAFNYDLLGRKIFDDYPGSADDVTYAYDDHINLTRISNAASAWTYFYNKRNLIEGGQVVIDGKVLSLDPSYDSLGNLQSLKTPTRVIAYAPDVWGRPTLLGSYASNVLYHPNGLIQSYSLGNGSSYTQTLDAQLRPYQQITASGSGIIQQYQYDYSPAGDLTRLADQTHGGASGPDGATLTYDKLHRLKSASGLWGSYEYSYDPLNNLRKRTSSLATRTYNYSSTTNRLTTVMHSSSGGVCNDCCPPGVQACPNPPSNSLMANSGLMAAGGGSLPTTLRLYTYNSRGEITGDSLRTFTVNNLGQITTISGIASYAYDGNGKRIKSTNGGATEYALYDRSGRLVYTERGAEKTDYLSLGGQIVAEIKMSGSADTVRYLHPDLLGSPRKATDANANVLWSEHFEPYGAKFNEASEKIGFAGHAFDAESGFTYMQARFYDPLIGRFLSGDPALADWANPFTFNRYAYANNNPYRFTDPDGRQSVGEMIDSGAEGCGPVSCAGWALLKGTWGALGAEGVSQWYDKGWSSMGGGNKVGAGLEIAAVLPPLKLLGSAKLLAKEGITAIGFSRPQLQHAFKHAADFGVSGNPSNKTLAEFSSAIQRHVDSSSTVAIQGTYRGAEVTHFVDPGTGLNVMKDASGNFLSGWKLSDQQLKHVLDDGKLGGGK